MIYISITFDYELYFNHTEYSDQDILMSPTNKILTNLNDLGTNATFFVDTCMMQRFEEYDYGNSYDEILSQLNEIIKRGHEIGLHLHPIWNTAEYKNGIWSFNPEDYMYKTDDFATIERDVDYGVGLINSVYLKASNRECRSFRAGGFSFYPEDVLYDTLYKHGIRIDSSVCKYRHQNASNQNYSYKRVPDKQYWFTNKGKIKEESEPSELTMLELPITATKDYLFKWISNYVYPNLTISKNGVPSELLYGSLIEKKFDRISKKLFDGLHLSLDGMNRERVFGIVEMQHRKNREHNDEYLVMIGHPKFQTSETIENIREIIISLRNKYDCQFVTLSDMYNIITSSSKQQFSYETV